MQFVYPPSQTIMKIERDKLPDLKGDDPIFSHFPEINEDAWAISWEQHDNVTGMQQYRGLNNAPPPVRPLGIRRMAIEPGVYGEHLLIDERKLTTRRQVGTFGDTVDVSDLVLEGHDQLASREFTRFRYMMWNLLQTGSYVATDQYSVVDHAATFTPQTYTASVAWSTPATATPLADFRAVADVATLGTSAVFDSTSTAYLNQTTFNRLISNTNANDIGGRRTNGLATINSPDDMSKLFVGDNLPTLKVLQDGYFDETTRAFSRYINTGKVVVIGRRPNGQSIGNLVMVRNAQNPGMAPGRYIRTIDKDISGMGPRSIELHRGFNGSVLIRFPRTIMVMNV